MFRKLTGLSILVTMLTMVVGSTAQAAIGGKTLSMRELYKLYAGKTWLWKTGGGYFRRDGRFIARTGYRKRSRVMGGWGAYRRGKICFSGRWRSGRWKSFDSTCFAHRRVGKTIYQKRLPAGQWYVFRSARGKKSDEYRKLARGKYTNWYVKYRRRSVKRKFRKRSRTVRRSRQRRSARRSWRRTRRAR